MQRNQIKRYYGLEATGSLHQLHFVILAFDIDNVVLLVVFQLRMVDRQFQTTLDELFGVVIFRQKYQQSIRQVLNQIRFVDHADEVSFSGNIHDLRKGIFVQCTVFFFYDKFALSGIGELIGIPFVENFSPFLYEIIGNTVITAIFVLELGRGKFFLLEIPPRQNLFHPCKCGNQFGNRTFTATLVAGKNSHFFYVNPSVHCGDRFLERTEILNLDSTHIVVI